MPRFHVVYVGERHPSLGNGLYAGMNKYAARELEIPFPFKANTIVVLRDQKRKKTLRHEETEIGIFRKGAGKGRRRHYEKAHKMTVRRVGS